jgi:ISXO2-like transposase domain
MYRKIAKQFAEHMTVNHSGNQYRDGDASKNTIKGFFSVFKRGMKAPISTAAHSTCTAISQGWTSATTTA